MKGVIERDSKPEIKREGWVQQFSIQTGLYFESETQNRLKKNNKICKNCKRTGFLESLLEITFQEIIRRMYTANILAIDLIKMSIKLVGRSHRMQED
jgi:hypothetical protein